jgi:hypothetical protein
MLIKSSILPLVFIYNNVNTFVCFNKCIDIYHFFICLDFKIQKPASGTVTVSQGAINRIFISIKFSNICEYQEAGD